MEIRPTAHPPAAADAGSLATRANGVTLARVLLTFGVAGMLYTRQDLYPTAFALTLAVIIMDAVDGWVARRYGEDSRLGAMIDILADRVVEVVYWLTFATLGWLPVWIPIVVVVRGLVVDGVRALALERGFTAFGPTTMMRSRLGNLVVGSVASRLLYALSKAAAFSLAILAFTPGTPAALHPHLLGAALASAYLSVFLCLARGLPVLMEARRLV